MKIRCTCDHIIVDQTDYLKNKGYLISDTQWFELWDSIDEAIEKPGNTSNEKEETCMQLRKQQLFKTLWECQECGKLFVDDKSGNLIAYSPDNVSYNKVLDKKETGYSKS